MKKSLVALACVGLLTGCVGNIKMVNRAVHGYTTRAPTENVVLPEGHTPQERLFVRDIGSPPAPNEMSILIYNVQRFAKTEKVTESVNRLLEEQNPDVALFQEIPRNAWEWINADGMNVVFAPFHQILKKDWPYKFDEYGQATMSEFPLEEPAVYSLPTVNAKGLGKKHLIQRIGVYTELPLEDGRTLRLLNVHNEPFAWDKRRAKQFEYALSLFPEEEGFVDAYCGDLNAAGNSERGVDIMVEEGFEDVRGDGLDRCLFRGHKNASYEKIETEGSDHNAFMFTVKY